MSENNPEFYFESLEQYKKLWLDLDCRDGKNKACEWRVRNQKKIKSKLNRD